MFIIVPIFGTVMNYVNNVGKMSFVFRYSSEYEG